MTERAIVRWIFLIHLKRRPEPAVDGPWRLPSRHAAFNMLKRAKAAIAERQLAERSLSSALGCALERVTAEGYSGTVFFRKRRFDAVICHDGPFYCDGDGRPISARVVEMAFADAVAQGLTTEWTHAPHPEPLWHVDITPSPDELARDHKGPIAGPFTHWWHGDAVIAFARLADLPDRVGSDAFRKAFPDMNLSFRYPGGMYTSGVGSAASKTAEERKGST